MNRMEVLITGPDHYEITGNLQKEQDMAEHYWYFPEEKSVAAVSAHGAAKELAKKLVKGPPVLALGTYVTGRTASGEEVRGPITAVDPEDRILTYRIRDKWILSGSLQVVVPSGWELDEDGRTFLHHGKPMTAEAVLAILKGSKA